MRGATLLELLTVLVVAGIMMAIAVPPISRALDRAAVSSAADHYATLFEASRELAVTRARFTRLVLDTAQASAAMLVSDSAGAWDTLRVWSLGRVRVAASQPVVAFSPLGIGWGVSNGRIVLSRGASAETLTVSRTGRLKRQ